jgi:hypothetical protein
LSYGLEYRQEFAFEVSGKSGLPTVILSNRTRDFPLEVIPSSITEIESMEKLRPNILGLIGWESRHQLQINRKDKIQMVPDGFSSRW